LADKTYQAVAINPAVFTFLTEQCFVSISFDELFDA
jgi:hypothetical protein